MTRDVSKRLYANEAVVPAWCDRIEVKYDPNNTECYACIWVEYANRYAIIAITGSYVDLPEARKQRVILHELCHLYTAPISDVAKNILKEYVEAAGLKVANGIITERLESATEDLAIMISHILPGPASAGGLLQEPLSR